MPTIGVVIYVLSIVGGLFAIGLFCYQAFKKPDEQKPKYLLIIGIPAIVIPLLINPTLKLFDRSGNPVSQKAFEKTMKKYRVSSEDFQKIKEQLNVTDSALISFFKILEEEKVSFENLDTTLQTIATHYTKLQQQLSSSMFDTEEVKVLKGKAKKALDKGDWDLAEKLLAESSAKGISCARQLKDKADECLLSAAESLEQNGDLATTQLKYKKAAGYYKQATETVPEKHELIKAGYQKDGEMLHTMPVTIKMQKQV